MPYTSANVERYHSKLLSKLNEETGLNLVLANRDSRWRNASKNTRFVFDVLSAVYSSPAKRRRGGTCLAFPLDINPDLLEEQLWASWHEDWKCSARSEFDLVGAGWTFFWGVDGRLNETQQILRAEWDQPLYRGVNVAQPHWHIDTDLMVGYVSPPCSQTGLDRPGLEELPQGTPGTLIEITAPEGIQEISISGMHLGMAGWGHHDHHPKCWQMLSAALLDELVVWSCRTLRITQQEFARLRIGEQAE